MLLLTTESNMSPIRAYNLGLMTPEHHLFEACRHLTYLYNELKSLHSALEESYDDDIAIQIRNLVPRIDTMEEYIREHADK